MLIVVSIGMKYLYMVEWVYYVVLAAAALVVLWLSPVEDQNKPLDETENKVYKKRTVLIAAAELAIGMLLKFVVLYNFFVAVVYAFVVLSLMIIAGKAKNRFASSK